MDFHSKLDPALLPCYDFAGAWAGLQDQGCSAGRSVGSSSPGLLRRSSTVQPSRALAKRENSHTCAEVPHLSLERISNVFCDWSKCQEQAFVLGFHPRVKQPLHWHVVRLVPRQPAFPSVFWSLLKWKRP